MNPLAILLPGAFREELFHFALTHAKRHKDTFANEGTQQSTVSAFTQAVTRELVITWLLLIDNAAAGLVLPCSSYIGIGTFLMKNGDLSIGKFVGGLVVTFAYFFLYMYLFDLCNQLLSVEEDEVNKPHRPIPRGLLSLESARQRVVPVICIWLALAFYLRVEYVALTWIVISVTYSKLGSHWFGKNFIMIPIGGIHLGVVSWLIVGVPWSELPMMRFVLQAVLYTSLVSMQDIRDMEGDMKLNRQTLPIVIGKDATRWLHVAITLLVFPVIYVKVFHGFVGVLKSLNMLLTVTYGSLLAFFEDNLSHRMAYDLFVLSFHCVLASEMWYRDVV